MKIAFVALWSPRNVRYWSGTPYYSFRAMREVFPDIHLVDTPALDGFLFRLGKLTRRARLDILREPLVRGTYNRLVARQLARIRPDVVISVGASHKLCDVPKDFRTIHVADALFASIIESYDAMSRLSPRSRRLGQQIQVDFLATVDALCLSSDWAVASAQSHYDLSDCRVKMLPLGANLTRDPGYDRPAREANRELSLLFVGGDWERKGGPLLLDAFAALRERHPDAVLRIVGCEPPEAVGRPGVTVHGFLDKTDPEDAAILDGLFRNAAFLVVPSRQEAFGIVFCEAGAYGLPSVGTRTGGIKSILVDGETGLLMPPDATPVEYADRIGALWSDRAAYLAMCEAARAHYVSRLSWSAWARGIAAEAERLMSGEISPDAPPARSR